MSISTGTIIDASTKMTQYDTDGQPLYTYRLIYVADPNGSGLMDVDGQFVRYISHMLIADRF